MGLGGAARLWGWTGAQERMGGQTCGSSSPYWGAAQHLHAARPSSASPSTSSQTLHHVLRELTSRFGN